MIMELFEIELKLLEIECLEGTAGIQDSLFVGSAFNFLLDDFEEGGSILMNKSTQNFLTNMCFEWCGDAVIEKVIHHGAM